MRGDDVDTQAAGTSLQCTHHLPTHTRFSPIPILFLCHTTLPFSKAHCYWSKPFFIIIIIFIRCAFLLFFVSDQLFTFAWETSIRPFKTSISLLRKDLKYLFSNFKANDPTTKLDGSPYALNLKASKLCWYGREAKCIILRNVSFSAASPALLFISEAQKYSSLCF